jgi:serine/threonine protein kinase
MVTSESNIFEAGIWIKYKPEAMIGQGVYGRVHRASNRQTQQTVAIKETISDQDGILPTTLRELAIMKQVNHPNIIKYTGVNLD